MRKYTDVYRYELFFFWRFVLVDDVVRLARGKSLTVGQLMGLLLDDRAILAKDPSNILKVPYVSVSIIEIVLNAEHKQHVHFKV